MRADAVRAEEWMEAAWAALTAGRPRELQALESLMERPLADRPEGIEGRTSLRQLEMLLALTARNLRVLRGQWQAD